MNFFIKSLILLTLLIAPLVGLSQETAIISGKVSDVNGKPIESAYIVLFGFPNKAVSDAQGYYELKAPAGEELIVFFRYIGYETKDVKVGKLQKGERKTVNAVLFPSVTEIEGAVVKDKSPMERTSYQRINPKLATSIPSSIGGIEALLKTLPGVTSNNELSSQYSVRGGNYDENLVYVNDIEIYRPFLIRSGQQEGLSFINSDLVSSINFSAGGFEARYGDKLSSVLDIQYKKPVEFAGSAHLSLLGGAFHLEGTLGRLAYLLGVRHKSNQYLLNTLETEGEYKPSFTDVQTLLDFPLTETWTLSFLGNYSGNLYRFIPVNRQTEFGMVNEAMRLKIYFDGEEKDEFTTQFGSLYATNTPNKDLKLKYIVSAFKSKESETYDIMGQYWLDELETDMSKDEFGESKVTLGVGTYLNHSRNFLDALVYNGEHKGTYIRNAHIWHWGIKYQREEISDRLSEWNMLDSADFTIPKSPDSVGYTNPAVQPDYPLEMQDVVKAKINLNSNRYSAYLQHTLDFRIDSADFSLITGLRASYWDFNNENVISPRVIFSMRPNWKRNYVFRISGGYYYQPPFYRELRDMQGKINPNLKSQMSVHLLAGMDHTFKAWNRPFKLTSEAYYKILDNLVPYKMDNVRIRYFAKNNSRGYATGIDFKVNGEFVSGIESWLSVSVMDVKENIKDDFYYIYYNKSGQQIIPGYTYDSKATDSVRIEPQMIPRPTDQRVAVSLFFQDYLPKLPSFQMHLNLTFATGLPFGPPGYDRYKDTLRMPPYRRVDIGFSAILKKADKKLPENNPFRHFKSIHFYAEVFNLLQVNNTLSYLWIEDVRNRQYAVPNYLTSRMLNFKLVFNF